VHAFMPGYPVCVAAYLMFSYILNDDGYMRSVNGIDIFNKFDFSEHADI